MQELIKIQSELNVPKSLYNDFGKYSYRTAELILEAVKPLLLKNECCLSLSDDIVMIGDRFYVKATATIKNKEGEVVTSYAFAREPLERKGQDASQITGTASSYARKYALNGLFCIDDVKDIDAGKATEEGNFDEIIKQINSAKKVHGLSEIWNSNPGLHNKKEFVSAITKKKRELE